jgi:hypothetical protein
MNTAEFTLAVRLRLQLLNEEEVKALNSISGGDITRRHNAIRDAIFYECRKAAFSSSLEHMHLLPGSGAKPADIFVKNFQQGKDFCFDASVVSSLHTSNNSQSAEKPGFFAESRFQEKTKKFGKRCQDEGLGFIPLVVESLGRWHNDSLEVLLLIASRAAARCNEDIQYARKMFINRLSVCLQKGNAAIILNHCGGAWRRLEDPLSEDL